MMNEEPRTLIYKLLREKVVQKQEAFTRAQNAFNELKTILHAIHGEMLQETRSAGLVIPIEFTERSDFEVVLSIGEDTLVFLLHNNIFTFESSDEIWKSSYVQEKRSRSYCGKIYIYNFLTDSLKFNRPNDLGYLIARIFINGEGHFFVEGERELGFLFNDFQNSVFDQGNTRKVLESAIMYSLDFDLLTPTYEQMSQITVQQVTESGLQSKIMTGKRVGFSLQTDIKAK